MGEAPGTDCQKLLLAAGCGRDRLVWHLGLLFCSRDMSAKSSWYTKLVSISTKGILEFREGGVKAAGQRVEDDLTWRYASHNGHQYIHIFGYLVHRMPIWGSVLCLSWAGVASFYLADDNVEEVS